MNERKATPHYQGCLNLLHAIYVLWWRDAQRNPDLLYDLAAWTDQPIEQVRTNRPRNFYSRCDRLSAQEQQP